MHNIFSRYIIQKYTHTGRGRAYRTLSHSSPISSIHNIHSAIPAAVISQLLLYFLIFINDIFIKCNCVDTRWQQYSTHLHTNNTYNETNHRRTQQVLEVCGPCPVFASYISRQSAHIFFYSHINSQFTITKLQVTIHFVHSSSWLRHPFWMHSNDAHLQSPSEPCPVPKP